MSQFQFKGAFGDKSKEKKVPPVLHRKQHKNIRFINRHTNEASNSSISVGTHSAPISTPSTPALSSSISLSRNLFGPSSSPTFSSYRTESALAFVSPVCTMGFSLPTPSTPSSLTISSIPLSEPTSTPSTIPSYVPSYVPSSVPTSTTNVSEPVQQRAGVQQGYSVGSTGLDGRLCIGVWKNVLLPIGHCSTIIYSSFDERVDPNGYNWASLSKETQLFYWDEFQKKCCWDDAITSEVQTSWEIKAKERYRQYIYRMRSTKRNKKPSHISSEVWTSWNAKWNTEEFKKISDQNKKNRRKGVVNGPALSTHTGGSASHLKIASNWKKRLGREPTRSELFLYTHTKNHDGTSFLHDKDKKIHDAFMERRDQLEAIGEEIDEDQLFYDVVGGHDHKRRLYGFGTYGKTIASSKGSTETCYSQDTNVDKERAETKAVIEQLKELIETQREQNEAKCGKLEQQLAQAMTVINALNDHVKTFTSQ